MSRRNFDEDDRSPKRMKYDGDQDESEKERSEARFSTLYSGAVYHVQSFLTMKELLNLARISLYFRQVSMGLKTPTGLHRKGKEVPFVTWDTVAHVKEQNSEAFTTTSSSSSSIIPSGLNSFRHELPTFPRVVDLEFERYLQQRGSSESLSSSDLNVFCAMTPAPDYGAPTSARRYRIIKENLHGKLLLSPIIGRHIMQLNLSGDYEVSDITLISLRFPYLRCLELEHPEKTWSSSSSCHNLSNEWKTRTKELRLPANLRILKLKASLERDPFDGIHTSLAGFPIDHPLSSISERVLSAMRSCPLLEEVVLSQVDPWTNLSPLLSLPNLTRLALENIHCITERPREGQVYNTHVDSAGNVIDQAQVVQQLAGLKFLQICHCDNLKLCLPTNCESLEEISVPASTSNSIGFRHLGERILQLRSLEVGRDLHGTRDSADWLLVDHSMMKRFQALHTLKYSQSLQGSLASACSNAHGSLQGHVEHVISNLIQLRSLTHLELRNFFTEPPSRSVQVHQAYFDSKNGNHMRTTYYLDQSSEYLTHRHELPGLSRAQKQTATPNLPYFPDISLYQTNSVFRLTAGLPHLLNLTLSGTSAGHLPSLGFLSYLPHLTSFSLHHARFLPIESLSDLKYVASTLTHLILSDCFMHRSHENSGSNHNASDVSSYLMHDVLQALLPSYPVTQAVTVKFPDHMKRPEKSFNNLFALPKPAKGGVATLVFNCDAAPTSGASSSSSSSCSCSSSSHPPVINPRLSSWYEIYRLPAPRDRVFRKRTLYEIACAHDEQIEENDLRWHPNYEVFKKEMETEEKRYGYHLIFDSFSALVPVPKDENGRILPLTFHLLPNLATCHISHFEPNNCITFTYDRTQIPRYRIGLPFRQHESAETQREKLRQQMQTLYGLETLDRSLEIEGFSYARFIPFEEVEKPLSRVFPLFQ